MGLISLDGPARPCSTIHNLLSPIDHRPALLAAHDDCVVVVLAAAGAEQQLL
jgi:hypothetical protein